VRLSAHGLFRRRFRMTLPLLLIDASPDIRLRRNTDDKSLMEDRLGFLGGNGLYDRPIEETASHKKFTGIEELGFASCKHLGRHVLLGEGRRPLEETRDFNGDRSRTRSPAGWRPRILIALDCIVAFHERAPHVTWIGSFGVSGRIGDWRRSRVASSEDGHQGHRNFISFSLHLPYA